MPDPTPDVAAFRRGLTKAQARSLGAIVRYTDGQPNLWVEASHPSVCAPGVCCDFLRRAGMLESTSDRRKWGRSIYRPTPLGRAVAAYLAEEEAR